MKERLQIPFEASVAYDARVQKLVDASMRNMAFYGIRTLSIEEDKRNEDKNKICLVIYISIPARGINPYINPVQMTDLATELYQNMVDYYNDNRSGNQKILSIRVETSIRKKTVWKPEYGMSAYLEK